MQRSTQNQQPSSNHDVRRTTLVQYGVQLANAFVLFLWLAQSRTSEVISRCCHVCDVLTETVLQALEVRSSSS